jgi:hypothetical protein
MAVDKDKLEQLLNQLPEELQSRVLEFAESLLERNREPGADSRTPITPVRSFFGIWDSGDGRSADNDRIDADLAREYSGSQTTDL